MVPPGDADVMGRDCFNEGSLEEVTYCGDWWGKNFFMNLTVRELLGAQRVDSARVPDGRDHVGPGPLRAPGRHALPRARGRARRLRPVLHVHLRPPRGLADARPADAEGPRR